MNSSIANSVPVCLITGGSSGIGLATARLFRAHGFHVAICGRSADRLGAAASEINAVNPPASSPALECFPVIADLVSADDARRLAKDTLKHFGRVDVLVNNAAMAPLLAFDQVDPATFEATINVNLRSPFYLTQLIWKAMQRQRGGVVVNISSMAAVDPFPGFSLYGASKAWVELMTVALAAEGEKDGIRVCAIRPGAVETPLLRGLFPDFPVDQCVAPDDIARAVWSCVAETDAIANGQIIPVTQQLTP